MKWPAVGLEARLRASFTRIFRHRNSRSRKKYPSKGGTMPLMSSTSEMQDRSATPELHFNDAGQVWSESVRSVPIPNTMHRSYRTNRSISPSTKYPNHETHPLSCKLHYSGELSRSDASVNTEANLFYRSKDVSSQADLSVRPMDWTENTQTGIYNTSLIDVQSRTNGEQIGELSYFENTHILSTNAVQHVRPLDGAIIRRHPHTEPAQFVQSSSHYCSDPVLFDSNRPGSRGLTIIRPLHFYAGDSCIRQTNSSTGCLTCLSELPSYSNPPPHIRPRRSLDTCETNRYNFESVYATVPRNHWFSPQTLVHLSSSSPAIQEHLDQHFSGEEHFMSEIEERNSQHRNAENGENIIFNSPILQPQPNKVDATCTSSEPQEDYPDLCHHHHQGKPTSEYGDADRRPRKVKSRSVKSAQLQQQRASASADRSYHKVPSSTTDVSSVNVARRPVVVKWGSRGRRRGLSYHSHTESGLNSDRVQGSEESQLGTDSLGDRQSAGRAPVTTTRRCDLSQRSQSCKKDARSNQCASGRSKGMRQAEERQMIHHNCAQLSKEVTNSQRSDKSDRSTGKYGLYPQSTSDDGDASKSGDGRVMSVFQTLQNVRKSNPSSLDVYTHFERSADHSSPSSSRVKSVQAEISTKSPPVVYEQKSRSPSQVARVSKQGGALPESQSLQQCPTGRHTEVKPEKPCICLMVKRMVLAQSKPVLYSWHGHMGHAIKGVSRPKSQPETSLTVSIKGSRSEPENLALPNFQLARPTRMVRGGQGTVAWVTYGNTGWHYALKFKHRDNRSDSTWAIERREAKLMRNAQHDFIVRLYHIYETEETLFMALEWLDGGCLWNHIARTGTLPECYVTYYAACILSALRYLHSRFIVYRDMKAENVVLDQRGRPKLIDFGMAKYFAAPCRRHEMDHMSGVDESVDDSADFEQPPTRYYFAAYLAPEIYDHSERDCHFIDSWGLGYILVEMILGYGIFLPMPWEKDPGMHLNPNWKLTLPNEATSRLSPVCDDFIQKMLLRNPQDRMELEQAEKHPFFSRVQWPNLANIRGPDLSKCSSRVTTGGPTGSQSTNTGTRRWVSRYNSTLHIPDLAFVKEFVGTLAPNLVYSTHAFGVSHRRGKIVRPSQNSRGNMTAAAAATTAENRSSHHHRSYVDSVGATTRSRVSVMGNAIEVRGISTTSEGKTRDGVASAASTKSNRATRRAGVQAAT